MRKCLVAVQGPLQFITAFMAMEWFGHIKHKSTDANAVLLLYDFGAPPELEKSLAESIILLSSIIKWDDIVFINSNEMDIISNRRFNQSIPALKKKVKYDHFDEIYVARDYCMLGSLLILNAYPNATRISYGDSFGIVGDEEITRFSCDRMTTALLMKVKSLIRGLLYGRLNRLPFDAAVLPLPIDWSGSYLINLPLLVPSYEYVANTIMRFSERLSELQAYCESLVATMSGDWYLYLLSNFANSSVSSIQNEIDLYNTVIKETAPIDANILLKNHPRSGPTVINSIVDKLGKDYNITIIDDNKLRLLPIELWSSLIKKSIIFPVYSSSAISITYIYNKQVKITLDDGKINSFIYKHKVDEIIKGNNMIKESLAALPTWDGKSPLWKGSLNNTN